MIHDSQSDIGQFLQSADVDVNAPNLSVEYTSNAIIVRHLDQTEKNRPIALLWQLGFEEAMEARANEVLELRKAEQDTKARQFHLLAVAKQQEDQLQVDNLMQQCDYRVQQHELPTRRADRTAIMSKSPLSILYTHASLDSGLIGIYIVDAPFLHIATGLLCTTCRRPRLSKAASKYECDKAVVVGAAWHNLFVDSVHSNIVRFRLLTTAVADEAAYLVSCDFSIIPAAFCL